MEWRVIDYICVPSGLLLMLTYHIWLLYQIIKHPDCTVIGLNAIYRRFWVRAMMEKESTLPVQTLRNSMTASTVLASASIMLSSLVAILLTGNNSKNQSTWLFFGDQSDLGSSIKIFSILVCFLTAFFLNIQSLRYYSTASILINVPFQKMYSHHHPHHRQQWTVEYVARIVNLGSYFWSMGLRAFYMSCPLFMWTFGPIPMFLCCFVLVFVLYFLDFNYEYAGLADDYDNNDGRACTDEEFGILGKAIC